MDHSVRTTLAGFVVGLAAVPLRSTIAPGDFIVFESIGAYSYAVRTNFNGFLPDHFAIVGD